MVIAAPTESTLRAQQVAWAGKVALIAKPGGPNTGVGRYVHMLHQGLRAAGVDVVRVPPTVPRLPASGYRLLRGMGLDLRTFLNNYPVSATYPQADVYHLTSQNLASLLLFRRPSGRVIVTVHDIIPYMLRNDPQLCSYRTATDRLFDRLAMIGLKRADTLISVSEYTKRCLVEHLMIDPGKVTMIHEAIDNSLFQPLAVPASIRERYDLIENRRYLIYVGSEHPRKNLVTLVRALAEVRRTLPDVELIKVGRAHFRRERSRLIDLAKQLDVLTAIHFLEEVPEQDLPLLYNLADVCIMPSLYEGFGFPLLEAMACGTPVVYANAASLPELGNGDGLVFAPLDVHMLAQQIEELQTNQSLASHNKQNGLDRARGFSHERQLQSTFDTYRC